LFDTIALLANYNVGFRHHFYLDFPIFREDDLTPTSDVHVAPLRLTPHCALAQPQPQTAMEMTNYAQNVVSQIPTTSADESIQNYWRGILPNPNDSAEQRTKKSYKISDRLQRGVPNLMMVPVANQPARNILTICDGEVQATEAAKRADLQSQNNLIANFNRVGRLAALNALNAARPEPEVRYARVDALRLRGGAPGTHGHSAILESIPIGSQVSWTGNELPSDDGHRWFEVSWGERTGWIREDMLLDERPYWIAARPQTATGRELEDFLFDIGFRESSNDYRRVNQFGFMGRFQFGAEALEDVGLMDSSGNWTTRANEMGVFNRDDFLGNPAVQNYAMNRYLGINWGYITNAELHNRVGTYMNGVLITESGLLASAHLIGAGGLQRAFRNGDLASVWDGNGVTALEYMQLFRGFNVENITRNGN